MSKLTRAGLALAVSIGAQTATAATLDSLIGNTLTAGDVAFSDFSFDLFGGFTSANLVDISATSTANSVVLSIKFEDATVSPGGSLSFGGNVTATTGGREFTRQTLAFGAFSTGGSFDTISASTDALSISTSILPAPMLSDSLPLGGTAYADAWAVSLNNPGLSGETNLQEILWTFDLAPGSTAVVPLPAAGWLMLAGLAGLAGLRRKENTG